jgi:hypothetical protein
MKPDYVNSVAESMPTDLFSWLHDPYPYLNIMKWAYILLWCYEKWYSRLQRCSSKYQSKLKMEAVYLSETLASTYKPTRCQNPEKHRLQISEFSPSSQRISFLILMYNNTFSEFFVVFRLPLNLEDVFHRSTPWPTSAWIPDTHTCRKIPSSKYLYTDLLSKLEMNSWCLQETNMYEATLFK